MYRNRHHGLPCRTEVGMISLTSACQCFCVTRWPPSDGYRVTLYGNAKSIIMEVIYRKIADIHPLPDNPRTIGPEDLERLKESIRNNPDYLEAHPLVLSDRTGELIVIDGNQRLRACLEMGMEEVPTALLSGLTEEREKEIIIRANVLNGKWDIDKLLAWNPKELMDWGVEENLMINVDPFFQSSEMTNDYTQQRKASLKDRFILPPFSILDTRKGEWQERKREWLNIGLKSEQGRHENITFAKSAQSPNIYDLRNKIREKTGEDPTWDEILEYCKNEGIRVSNGISIFDPVLCELMYRWFNVPKGNVLDPFAGGSVRGVVASKLRMNYLGIDLRQEQIDANIENAKEILSDDEPFPIWKCGDSLDIIKLSLGYKADMILSCPPYADLEVYSDNPKDLSTMNYPEFKETYERIIADSCSLLKDNSFAVFVVGEARSKNGFYYGLVPDTIEAFEKAGLHFYNELILVNNIGSLAIRVGNQFNNSRKTGKHHQNVLVFYKGQSDKEIKNRFEEINLTDEDINKILLNDSEY